MTELYAEPSHVESADDCKLYHVMDLPGVEIPGASWDLRPNVDAYLGGVELEGRRVLEIGPATGYLSFHMEAQGARVVAVELGPDTEWDLVPHSGVDHRVARAERTDKMERMRRTFWFAHERVGSSVQVHYASAYSMPDELGHFDLATLGSVLLHLRDPLRAVARCAQLAETLVITDRHWADLDGLPVMRLA